jgi:predicted nucleic acid-binding protein
VAVRFLLDTNAVLYLLGDRLAFPLEPGRYYTSVISEMKLLSYPSLTAEEENRLRSFLQSITVVELTQEVKKAAVELRRRHTVKLPDAIVAASAVVLGAELLTNDRQLLQITGVQGKSLHLKT